MKLILRVFCLPLLVLAVQLGSRSEAQSCAAGPPNQIGQVTVLQEPCQSGPGGPPGATCQVLRVECQGIPPIEVELRISEPPPDGPLRGTVVFGTGGGGVGFYGNQAGGTELVASVREAGFRVVERSWRTGWFSDDFGVRKQSCRYATLLNWIHDNVHTDGAFCATGNSGGSGEICYSLTSWGTDAILDVAVPSGGPPMSRLDFLCGGSPQWQTLCPTVVPPNVMTCGQPACTTQPNNQVCTACSSTASLQELRQDSILHPNAVLDFPTTRVHSVIGTEDCGSAVPAGMLFFNAVTSEKIVEFAVGAPHFVPATPSGRQAILRALLQGAACTSGPATLAATAWPQVGGPFHHVVSGPPSGAFAVYYALDSGLVELPGLGWGFLHQPINLLGTGTLDGAGEGTLSVQVPNNPGLAGLDVFTQSVIAVCLSNLVHVQIL